MTAQEKSKDTKISILLAANELFASKGFGETSMRDIANHAAVNLAAINYHFMNKQNLYRSVFDYNYNWINQHVEELGKSEGNTVDLTIDVFRFFVKNGMALMNTFKIFLNDYDDSDDSVDHVCDKSFGPPGQDVFYARIVRDVGSDVPDESIYWAVRMIFTLLVHKGIILNTKMMKEKYKQDASFAPQLVEQAIVHSARAHLAYLKKNPTLS